MKRSTTAIPLFEDRKSLPFEAKLRTFAHEVAKRHRGRPADPKALVAALRGYYRTWSIFERLPPLDDRALTFALAEYELVRTGRRSEAA